MKVKTFRARYRLDIGDSFREPGELVPEAVTWFRRESYLHTGRIVEVHIERDEFDAAVARYCPEDTELIHDLTGITDGVAIEGPHGAPRCYGSKKPEPVITNLKASRKASKPEPDAKE